MIRKILLGLLILLLVVAGGGYLYYKIFIYQPPAISDEDRAQIQVMPLPAKLTLHGGKLALDEGLNIEYPGVRDVLVDSAVSRFSYCLAHKLGRSIENAGGVALVIDCKTKAPDIYPTSDVDESYQLEVEQAKIILSAPTPFGIIHGLETIYQLIDSDGDGYAIPAATIADHPRFAWRGLMLDVSRHWMPKEVILRNLNAMAAVKMNVFHWHLSDDQGFRVESKRYPKLHEIGANGKYYTQQEIKDIVRYAALRGIRVVPEFDLPGHSKSWQMAYPELSSVKVRLSFGQTGDVFSAPIDPTRESTYEFIDGLVEEMTGLFPDACFHMGGDEVSSKYWDENAAIQKFMDEHALKDAHDLQAYFNGRVHEILTKHHRTMLGWGEILHPDLSDDIIIQSWKNQKSLFQGVQQGAKAILSAGYYLDYKLHASEHYKVDPLVLPGAVDIVPDSANWKMYQLTIHIPSGEMEGELVIFDRDTTDVFGYFAIMDSRMPFKGGTVADCQIHFEMNSPMGKLGFEGTIAPDSLDASLSFGLLHFDAAGPRNGGSDMPGTKMPKIEIVKPLTDAQKAMILGGEAAMWSELVSSKNVDSRIWPRTAVIAEKLWSPAELTADEADMYRRLPFISTLLAGRGSTHLSYYPKMLHKLIPDKGYETLKNLVDVLEEVKYYNRMSSVMNRDGLYLPDLPLDGIADAARPESPEARDFNAMVDVWLADSTQTDLRLNIINQLKKWSEIHERLQPYLADSAKLMEFSHISEVFSGVALAGYQVMNDQSASKPDSATKQQIMEKLTFLEQGEHGALVAVVPGLRALIGKY